MTGVALGVAALGVAVGAEAATVAVAVWPLSGAALPGALLAEHAATLTVTSKPIPTSTPLLLTIPRFLLPPALLPRAEIRVPAAM